MGDRKLLQASNIGNDRLIIGNLYNKALRSCIYIYMLAIAGKTAEPNWLSGNPAMGILGVTTDKNNKIFFLSKIDFLKISRATPDISAS